MNLRMFRIGMASLALAACAAVSAQSGEGDPAAEVAAEIKNSLRALEALASEENIRQLGESLQGLGGLLSEENVRQLEEAIGSNLEHLGELASEENMGRWAESMEPMFENLYSAYGKIARDLLSDPELVAAQAAYVKNFVDALVRQGFSRNEALEVVIGLGLPRLN